MNNSLFSKYIAKETIIHNLDPRSKLLFVTSYLILVFLAKTKLEFFILIVILLLAEFLSKISFKYLISGFKLVFFIIMFTSIVHLIFNKTGEIVLTIFGYSIYSGAFNSILLIIVRFFLVVSIMIIFTITTSPSEITNAINTSFNFLNRIGLNVNTFALLISISLRFIPTIGEETSRIINAQISRGANLKSGGIISRIKGFNSILIPIFVSTLKRADELATAMEVRGYNPNFKRTRYKTLKYSNKDYLLYIITLLLIIFIIIY